MVVFVLKKNDSFRFCVDYRRLNAVTERDSYLILRMDEGIDSLGNAKVLLKLEHNSSYWQIGMDDRDVDETAFIKHHGLSKYTRMRLD